MGTKWGTRVTRNCKWCSTGFEVRPSSNKRMCSPECTKESRRFAAKNNKELRKPRTGEVIPCETCGADVYRNKAEARLNKRFCSNECLNVWQRRDRQFTPCETCGKGIEFSPSQQSWRRFCSRECKMAAIPKRPAGFMHNGRHARIDNYGYVMVWEPDHPNQSLKGWQYQHRLVAEEYLGRYLASEEHVHHIDDQKANNSPENLEVLSVTEHNVITQARTKRDRACMKAELEEYRRRFGPLTDWSYIEQ